MKTRTVFIMTLLLTLPNLAQATSLQQQLKNKSQASAQKIPAATKKVMAKAIADLKKSQVMKTVLQKGQNMPPFALQDVQKGTVRSQDLLGKGPLIVTFYRGGWCPYCNLQLRDLQKHLPEIQKAGAQLVAISPEAPDRTAETVKKSKLAFYVLSDNQGQVSKNFGLTYALDKDLIAVYKKFGLSLIHI